MSKCECYEEREIYNAKKVIDYYSLNFDRRLIGICNGTKEREECHCGGNPVQCDFYSKVREKAEQSNQEYRDKKELEFYRWWVTEHNLNVEVATAFEKYLKRKQLKGKYKK